MSKQVITLTDIEAAKKLKEIWTNYKNKYGITQEEFAFRLGFSQSNFSIYLNAKQSIGLKTLVKLADALECNCSDIRQELKDKY